MKYEPIKNKKQKMKDEILKLKNKKDSNELEFYSGFEKGVDNSFNLFASFIELYKKYKGDVKLLMNEQKNIWSKWVEYYEQKSDINTENYIEMYNNWLFDYIFSDVNGKNSDFLNL